MNYEEKYKQALKRDKTILELTDNPEEANCYVFTIFPELKESEDEKWREWLINHLKGYINQTNERYGEVCKDAIAWLEQQKSVDILTEEEREFAESVDAFQKSCEEIYQKGYDEGRKIERDIWLEKQVEQKTVRWDEGNALSVEGIIRDNGFVDFDCSGTSFMIPVENDFKNGDKVIVRIIKQKQGEQNPTDKIEPKFKVGDWVIYVCGEDLATLQIKNIVDGTYEFTDDSTLNVVDENTLRLWTIQDAKKGDILQANKCTLIFDSLTKSIDGDIVISSWYSCDAHTFYAMGPSQPDLWVTEGVVPVTKEQRDFLFQKMKEAGYEWDAEKKELRAIKQSCYHNDGLYYAIDILEKTLGKVEGYQSDDGKMEHQIAIETVNALYHKKPAEWSEKDEEMFDAVIADIKFTQKAHNNDVNQVVYEKEIDWLKSIKDRIQPQSHWKPSEEQLRAIINSAQGLYQCKEKEVLLDLYEQLKNL